MEELEQESNLVALGEEAQEVFRKACEDQGINHEEVQAAVNNLAALCICLAEQTANTFNTLTNTLAENIDPTLHALSDALNRVFNSGDLFFMVPSHIKHFAYNNPKARVRKKNWNRMRKICERYMKWHKD